MCFFLSSHSQLRLSEEAEIAVMTMGPYQEEIYSVFGHTAIRISDPVNDLDWVFNYGVFDFDQENFYWNFARGQLLYSLGLAEYAPFKRAYIAENRYIVEQYLNLTTEEKQEVFNFLLENRKPENREYLYNYVYDNCSTKVPEILRKIFPGRIHFPFSFVEEGTSIRDLMDEYLTWQPWGDWIIDIGLGSQIDREATGEIYLFLPEYVMKAFDEATFARDSAMAPLVLRTVNVFIPEPEKHSIGLFTPFNVFVLIFFIVGFITNRNLKREKRSHWIDVILFTFVGLIGWWLVFLWAATDHLSKENMNLLWAIPIYIPMVYLLKAQRSKKFLVWFFQIAGILHLMLLIVWGLLPQPLHNALIPLVLTLILRCFYISYDVRNQLKMSTR